MIYSRIITTLMCIVLLSITTVAGTIYVPADSSTIQFGINGAIEGDTVLVAPGIYTENINFNGKNIVLLSVGGRDSTTIKPADSGVCVVTFSNSEDSACILDGFTINGDSTSPGIYCNEASPIIQNCSICFCRGDYDNEQVGIYCENSAACIRRNIIQNNKGSWDYAGIGVRTALPLEITENIIYNNDADNAPGIGILSNSSNVKIKHNLIYDNFGTAAGAAGIQLFGHDCEIINNTIVNNSRGIVVYGGSNSTIINNIIVSNNLSGIDPGAAFVDYNDIRDNGSNNMPGPHGISLDPIFSNPSMNDFSLKIFSPCIDAGCPDPIYNDSDGTPNDMGAFTFERLDTVYTPIAVNINLGDELMYNVIDHKPTIFWSIFDSVATPRAFQIRVGTLADWPVPDMWSSRKMYINDTSVIYEGLPLQDGETYFISIRVHNNINWGSWQNRLFRMNSKPAAPNPVYPLKYDLVNVNHVELITENAYDGESDALTYEFEIYDDLHLTNLVFSRNGVVEGTDSTSSGLITGLADNTQYWWRVRAFDGFYYSEWSPDVSFFAAGGLVIHVPEDIFAIQYAINASYDGDTILVSPGEYATNIDFNGKDIVVKSSDGPEVTILKSGTVILMSGESSNARFSGFTLTGSANIKINYNSSPLVDNNIFHDINDVAIHCGNSNPTIARNLFYSNGGISCIAIYTGSASVINNTFDRNTRGFFSHGVCMAINNIVTNSTEYGIAGNGFFQGLDYNNVWNNNPDYSVDFTPAEHNISANPLYNNPDTHDYTLLPESPCIDAGHPDTLYYDPDGTRNDIGAFPYYNEPPSPFQILSPPEVSGEIIYNMLPLFQWQTSTVSNPLDSIHYTLCISTDSEFVNTIMIDSLWSNFYPMEDSLDFGVQYWWKVKAINNTGRFTYSLNTLHFKTWRLGDTNGDWGVNIYDIAFLINYIYLGGSAPLAIAGDVSGDCAIDLFDISCLISFLYLSGSPPQIGCE